MTDQSPQVLTFAGFRALLPTRAANADKRSSGAPLLLVGSETYPGAAVLCARAAARAGAGYVTVVTPRNAAATIRAHLIEQVVISFDESEPTQAFELLLRLSEQSQALAVGPGLSLSPDIGAVVCELLTKTSLPAVIDASALSLCRPVLHELRKRPCILTPHAGEFARLSGIDQLEESERPTRLRAFVNESGLTTLLKGQPTLIDDGQSLHQNPTGTNALATAGTGDVLTGIIATLLSQGLSPVDAARVGAYWHGLAGQAAAEHRSIGVLAGDLPEHLSTSIRTR